MEGIDMGNENIQIKRNFNATFKPYSSLSIKQKITKTINIYLKSEPYMHFSFSKYIYQPFSMKAEHSHRRHMSNGDLKLENESNYIYKTKNTTNTL